MLRERSQTMNGQALEVWVGLVGVRQLPGSDHKIELTGKGAFTWVTCWATDVASYETKVSEVMAYYGLFVVECNDVMPFTAAEDKGIVTDELLEQFEVAAKDEKSCPYGTFHNYLGDN